MSLASTSDWHPVDPNDLDWDLATVGHLHRRSGFGAHWKQLQHDLQRGFEPTLLDILRGTDRCPNGRARFTYEEIAAALEVAAEQRETVDSLERAWFYRMIFSPHPLAERMALMWHDHYPISAAKVFNAIDILDYARRLRRDWNQPISKLHLSVLTSPAMLRWLDGLDISKRSPNENLAREFFELFALGEGAYAEADIRETARALTGLVSVDDPTTRTNTTKLDIHRHDDERKTILGETGRWKPADVVRIAIRQEAAAIHIARRLFQTFISDQEYPNDQLIEPLATHMRRDGDVDVMAGVEMIFRSKLFYDPKYRGCRVKSPIEFIVGAIRGCAAFEPSPDLNRATMNARRMGQRLFHAPSVAGWPSGLAWLDGSWSVARANFAGDFAETAAPTEGDPTSMATTLWGVSPSRDVLTRRIANALSDRQPQSGELLRWMLSQPEANVA